MAVCQDVSSDIGEKGGFVHMAISSIKRHQFGDIGEPCPKFPQDCIDVPHDYCRLGSQIRDV
jgi:hypothetical protein